MMLLDTHARRVRLLLQRFGPRQLSAIVEEAQQHLQHASEFAFFMHLRLQQTMPHLHLFEVDMMVPCILTLARGIANVVSH